MTVNIQTPPLSARPASRGTLSAIALTFMMSLAVLLSLPVSAEPGSAMPVKVNINQADAQTLADALVGVGLQRANAIVKYRQAYGPFTSLDELEDVNGIGKSTIERNKAVISLE